MSEDPPGVRVDLERLYYRSLGLYIHLFGLTEAMLRRVLTETVGVDEPTALAIFSGVRADGISSLIRRCYEARNVELPAELSALLQQFAVLNNLRNDLIHHGVDFKSDPPVATNRHSVINLKAVRR